jgi:hypothetical protein
VAIDVDLGGEADGFRRPLLAGYFFEFFQLGGRFESQFFDITVPVKGL